MKFDWLEIGTANFDTLYPSLDEIKEKLANNSSYVCTSFHMHRPHKKT